MSIADISNSFDVQFTDPALLDQALTHRSLSRTSNNERLEFLGDSVLSLVITEFLYKRFDNVNEGKLSRLRASLVNQQSLASLARQISLGDHIRLGGGELKSGGFRRDSILSDALEAIIGAIYLDSGFDQARRSVLHLYRDRLENLSDVSAQSLKDAKTQLQEILQSRQIQLPDYEVIRTDGKDHNQVFTVSCRIQALNSEATAKGNSRKKAEQRAAAKLVKRLQQ